MADTLGGRIDDRRGLPTLVAALAMAALAGCMPHGSGGADAPSTADAAYSGGPIVAITGRVTYQRVPTDHVTGLNYATQYDAPARGVVVEVRDDADVLVERGNADADGNYALHAAQNKTNRVIALAELGDPRFPEVAVVDNRTNGPDTGDATHGKVSWAVDATVAVTTTPATLNLRAPSGVSSRGVYQASRPAAPFAILDVVYSARQLVRSADASASFPRLGIQWSPELTNVGFYDPTTKMISLDGVVGDNTDEYDTHVIAHEWTHYFEDNFARSDNLGGAHYIGDILDPSIAWSEGFSTAMSGIITSTLPGVEALAPDYVDSSWTTSGAPTLHSFWMDLEGMRYPTDQTWTDGSRTYDGYWSETSVQELVYNLWDTTSETGEDVAVPFTAIYQAEVASQRSTPYFLSVVTFLSALEDAAPEQAAAIRAEAKRWDIGPAGYGHGPVELATPATMHGMLLYTNLQADGTVYSKDVDGDPLQVSREYMADPDYFNKLFGRRMFDAQSVPAGRYQITVTTPTAGDAQKLEVMFPGDGTPKYPIGRTPFVATVDWHGGDLIFSVGMQYGYDAQDIPFSVQVSPVTSTLVQPVGPG